MTASILSDICIVISLTLIIGLYISKIEEYEEQCVFLIKRLPKHSVSLVKVHKLLIEAYLYILMMIDIILILDVLKSLYK